MKASTFLRLACCGAVLMVTLGAGAAGAHSQSRHHREDTCATVYGQKVCTFYRTRAGKVTAFGMSVPVAAIERAPADAPMVWPPREEASLPFAPAVREQTGFTYANVYWEAHGHPPSIYMVPHFDFHFYFVPEKEVKAITCKDTSKPRVLPAGYTLPDVNAPPIGDLVGLCVPAMGMHAVASADLDAPGPWTGSMLVGYYSRKAIFIEPMVTRALLLKKRSFSLPTPKVEAGAQVRIPKHFRAVYRAESQNYHFTWSY